MRQKRTSLEEGAVIMWRPRRLVAAAVLLALWGFAKGSAPGDVIEGPDQKSMFEVHGRTFWNKSLGYDQQPHGVLGHQCAIARPSPHPKDTLTYTPNRKCVIQTLTALPSLSQSVSRCSAVSGPAALGDAGGGPIATLGSAYKEVRLGSGWAHNVAVV